MSIERGALRWNGWGWAAHADELSGRAELWAWLAQKLGMPSLLATPARAIEDVTLPAPRLYGGERARLVSLLSPDRVRDDPYERAFHALGRSYHDLLRLRAGTLEAAPDAVLYPHSTDEVLAVLSFAAENGLAIIPYGGGTSVVGGVSAAAGGHHGALTLDLSLMERVVTIDPVARTATVQAGIYGPALGKALQAKGMTLGHHPQSFEFSTLGGWIGHRGAGQGSLRYGRAEDWLAGVTLATPQGLLTAQHFPASAAGPQLKDIVLGSEGVFGVVTEATIRLHTVAEHSDYRGFLFRDFAQGAAAIRTAMQEGVKATMLRLSDTEETRFFRAFSDLGKKRGLGGFVTQIYLDAKGFDDKAAALIAGFEGDAQSVEESVSRFTAIATRLGALPLGQGQGERWRDGRFHGPYLRDPLMDRGVGVDTLETAASWSKLDGLYAAVRDALDTAIRETAPMPGAHGIVMCHISHAYSDGASLYFTFIFPRALGDEIGQWQKIKRAASDAILANGGTISHHHGVGEDHLPWIAQEKGPLGIEVLRAIKRTLDPKGIMNPGKLIPA